MAEGGALTRKMGPLPVWAWGLLGGIAVYFLYTRYKSGQTSTGANTGPVASVLDPNAVDPATGLTYGQEMGGNFPVSSPGFGGAGTTASDTGAAAGTDFVSGFDAGQSSFLDAMNAFQQLSGSLGLTPPNPSAGTVNVTLSEPLKNTTKPPTKASSHHKQRTMHVANPGSHQHAINPRKSKAHPVPVKHPASGGNPGKVQSGSHNRVPATKPTTRQIHRGGVTQTPPRKAPAVQHPLTRQVVTTPGRRPPPPPPRKKRR